jgi:hypothetical protein
MKLGIAIDRARIYAIAAEQARRFVGGWTWKNSGISGDAVGERTTVLVFEQRG